MRAVALIAGNFLREQRWLIILLLVWVTVSSVALGIDGEPVLDDALFFLRQQAVYGVAFGGFLAASAIYNERRSRRILSVLSKGIERRQYLAGLLAGIGAIEGIYGVSMGVGGAWMLRHSGIANGALWWVLLALFLAAMLVTSLSLLFSTFLNPLLALAGTAVAIGFSAGLTAVAGAGNYVLMPVYPLLAYVMGDSLRSSIAPDPRLLGMAAIEIAIFWMVAASVFARRDIAAAVE